jgi:hypothetical protein
LFAATLFFEITRGGAADAVPPPVTFYLDERENDRCKRTEDHHNRHNQAEDSQAFAHNITSLF